MFIRNPQIPKSLCHERHCYISIYRKMWQKSIFNIYKLQLVDIQKIFYNRNLSYEFSKILKVTTTGAKLYTRALKCEHDLFWKHQNMKELFFSTKGTQGSVCVLDVKCKALLWFQKWLLPGLPEFFRGHVIIWNGHWLFFPCRHHGWLK